MTEGISDEVTDKSKCEEDVITKKMQCTSLCLVIQVPAECSR